MSKLLPCPFCGGEAKLWLEFEPYEDEYAYDERNLWHCGCERCGIEATAYWEEKWAIEDWNTRTPDVVEVVRCKDCEHRYSSEFCECRPEDAYCSDGERRKND